MSDCCCKVRVAEVQRDLYAPYPSPYAYRDGFGPYGYGAPFAGPYGGPIAPFVGPYGYGARGDRECCRLAQFVAPLMPVAFSPFIGPALGYPGALAAGAVAAGAAVAGAEIAAGVAPAVSGVVAPAGPFGFPVFVGR